jgi:reverse gyrase
MDKTQKKTGLCSSKKKKSKKEKLEENKCRILYKKEFYDKYLGNLEHMKDINFDFILNDDAEVLIRIRPKKYMTHNKFQRNSDDMITIPSES